MIYKIKQIYFLKKAPTHLQSLQTPLEMGLDWPSGVKGDFQWNALGHLKVLTFLCVLHNLTEQNSHDNS